MAFSLLMLEEQQYMYCADGKYLWWRSQVYVVLHGAVVECPPIQLANRVERSACPCCRTPTPRLDTASCQTELFSASADAELFL